MQSHGKNVAVRSVRNTVKVHLIIWSFDDFGVNDYDDDDDEVDDDIVVLVAVVVSRTKWKKSGHNDNNIEWSSD